MDLLIHPCKNINSVIKVPGDKSISHRSVMIAAIASGLTEIEGFLPGQDCMSTVNCIRQLGINVETTSPGSLRVHGQGLKGLSEPGNVLYVGNSGTTIRLLSGLLSGQEFYSVLSGDNSIRRRPMGRVVKPLQAMGAQIWGRSQGQLAPLSIKGSPLHGIHYDLPVASAQLKSALLFAGLYADSETSLSEPAASRDHTENMLKAFGAKIERHGQSVAIQPGPSLLAQKITVPGDISSAAFFLTAAAIIPGNKITIRQVGLNPTRTGILDVLEMMGARISRSDCYISAGELIGDISIEADKLRGIDIGGDLIPRLIDEIPVLAVAAAAAEGRTIIRDAHELKVKESNRLQTIAQELQRFGVRIQETEDGLSIEGGGKYQGAICDSHDDHRIAMSCAIMGLLAEGSTKIQNAECIDISFPSFAEKLKEITGQKSKE